MQPVLTIKIDVSDLAQAINYLAAAIQNCEGGLPVAVEAAETAVETLKMVDQPVPYTIPPSPEMPAPAATPAPSAAAPAEIPMQTPPVQPGYLDPATIQNAPVPTTAPSYTMDQLAIAAMQLKDAGRLHELTGLLSTYGVSAMTQLDPAQYASFAGALRGLGVQL